VRSWTLAVLAIPLIGVLAACAILRPPARAFDWSQQTLRSPGENDCRAAGRIPYFDQDGIFIECMQERQ
jgi:hypothetical protein